MPICQYCGKEYNIEDSVNTGSNENPTDYLNYCSIQCQNAEANWLAEGNKTIQSAKENNPSLFARSEMSTSEQQALETFKNVSRAGVKFSKD